MNTDFPNYYLAASLAHEGFDTTRMYEWRWLQREKDHRNIDQPIIGLAPITPFSTLVLWPLTSLSPLHAKHVWTILQLALLLPLCLGLRALTAQPLRRIVLIVVTCIPLHRNLLYGQLYILLLCLLVAACWAYHNRMSSLAGSLIAVAAMLKIFPAVFLLYFLRKRDWPALAAAAITLAACTLLSVHIFGWQIHRTYVQSILPWTLRGEAMPPYAIASASISTLLHRLFVYEPQWNPHPWHNQPALLATLGPILQTLVLAPALLLIRPASPSRHEAALEWSALLTATLTISTVPASYNFTLLILPAAVLCRYLKPALLPLPLAAGALYLGIVYPGWNTSPTEGWHALLHVPRLYCLLLFTALCCYTLARTQAFLWTSQNQRWALALTLACTCSIVANLRHLRGAYDDLAFRLPMQADTIAAFDPQSTPSRPQSIELIPTGYRLANQTTAPYTRSDILSYAASPQGIWIEEAGSTSRILPPALSGHRPIDNAHSPILSPNGQDIAYIRDTRGRGRLFESTSPHEMSLTPTWMNVEEAAYLTPNTFAVAATLNHGASAIYIVEPNSPPQPTPLGEARYPAPSPDGHWLAYSRYDAGTWNLWLEDRTTGKQHAIAEVPCNQTQPSWESDSQTLLYASDCGRALGLTALCRRRVVSQP